MIELVKIRKSFGEVLAVDDVSFSVPAGEVFGLLGPNGAGKTTIVKMATALTRPDAGCCRIGGTDVAKDPLTVKTRIGVVPQANNLDRELTAYENLLIYGMLHRVAHLRDKITGALKTVELWDRRDSVVQGFSGGMQRRLLLARALLPEPQALFLDEPSIGLDPQIRSQLWEIIRKIQIDGRTVLLTTHYIEEAEALCDRVGILAKGRLIALDTPDNLRREIGEYVVESVDGDGKLRQSFCLTREDADRTASVAHSSVRVRATSLEDAFIDLTKEKVEK
jgi:ABC-2 type transport system ATP-binding protein